MKKSSDVFTTSEVASICRVSTRIVTKWYANQILTGYTLPGSKHRRFTESDIRTFMVQQKLPIDWLDQAVGKSPEKIEVVETAISE